MDVFTDFTRPPHARTCAFCPIKSCCQLNDPDSDFLPGSGWPVRHEATIVPKGTIFLQNSPFTSVFIVKSGTVKTFHVDERGVETILAFYLPGQMFGFDGIASGVHSCSAVALERTHICRPGVRVLNSTVIARPNIMQGILKEISRELNNAERRNRWLSQSTAEERVVDFLLDVAKRYRQCQLRETEFRLAMGRSDIANFLGLALETVSRIITKLNRDRLIDVHGRHVRLLEIERLRARSHAGEQTPSDRARRVRLIKATSASHSFI